ncbi:hypothetical protein [Rhodocyclus tenuis]|uniref:Uncharacterized protein n=1 Tax=Rhodocyclus tenuis TaxID=1066 RepID=A0A840GB02_RHOTE|nr:hypothetical protein [Rhodocyclus tenuis]MBB4249026.1 hypothetical protein [Rhodocyclus tenuis]
MSDEFGFPALIGATFAVSFILYGLMVFVRDLRADWPATRADLLQPWKLVTLTGGEAWLIHGALSYRFADWDVGVSMLMAGITYLAAPWCARAVFYRRWKVVAGVMVMCWLAVDGSYTLWHTAMEHETMRAANFPASAALFWLCGFIWLPRGGLRDIIARRAPLL